jgi:hypothetical protein
MRQILTSIAVCGACALAACSTSSPLLTAAPPVVQTAAVEPAPIRPAPRPRRPARAADPETTSTVSDAKPVVYNSPEWKEREKRREEELNRKIYNICRGC